MIRKLLFGAIVALVFAAGALVVGAVPGNAGVAPMMSAVPHSQANGNLLDVKACGPWNNWCYGGGGGNCGPWNNWCGGGGGNCGPWNNWCHPGGGGGASGCIMLGGVQLCVGGGGSNCHWYNGQKYCGGGGGGSCIYVSGHSYCSYKHNGPCVWSNGVKYCRY